MNLKAKTEWRRSGERAGAGTSPARATGLATSLPHLSAFSGPPPPPPLFSGGSALSPPSRGLPFLREAPRPSCSSCGPFSSAPVPSGSRSPRLGGWGYRLLPIDQLSFRTSAAAFCPVCELLRAVEHVLSFPPGPSAPQRKAWKCHPPLLSPARAWLLLPFSALPERRRSQN